VFLMIILPDKAGEMMVDLSGEQLLELGHARIDAGRAMIENGEA